MNIIKCAFGTFSCKHTVLRDNSTNHPDDFHPDEKFDLIIQLGSPFVWHRMHLSRKWKNMHTAMFLHPQTPVVMMGVGSCFNLGTTIEFSPDDIKDIYGQSRVTTITRDNIAQASLSRAGVYSTCLPCPAFFSHQQTGHLKSPAIVWYDPRLGLSSSSWKDSMQFTSYVERFRQFHAENPSAAIYTINQSEIDSARRLGLFEGSGIELILDTRHNVDCMSRVSKLLSGRVHCAVPAFIAGADVELIPIDTRHRTLEDWRHDNPTAPNFLATYKEILTSALHQRSGQTTS